MTCAVRQIRPIVLACVERGVGAGLGSVVIVVFTGVVSNTINVVRNTDTRQSTVSLRGSLVLTVRMAIWAIQSVCILNNAKK